MSCSAARWDEVRAPAKTDMALREELMLMGYARYDNPLIRGGGGFAVLDGGGGSLNRRGGGFAALERR